MPQTLDSLFDVLVVGTGLSQSITAAALAQAGCKVLHVDPNPYYGSRHASLTFEELLKWASLQSAQNCGVYSSFSYRFPSSSEPSIPPVSLLAKSRQYAISLSPSLVPGEGNLIDTLVKSGVSRYGEFRLLDALGMIRTSDDARAQLHLVPSTKEDIFKDKHIPLIIKRKFMKMLQFAIGEYEESDMWRDRGQTNLVEFLQSRFGIPSDFASAVALAVAFSPSHEPVDPAFARLRRYARSAGRYGKSSFLIGHFGGLGEMAQWFCRSCAVNGGTYMLASSVQSIRRPEAADGQIAPLKKHSVSIEGVSNLILVSSIVLPGAPSGERKLSPSSPEKSIIRGIVIVDQPVDILDSHERKITIGDGVDNVAMAFDPSYIGDGPKDGSFVTCFLTGYGTMSCPKGQVIIYLSCTMEPAQSQNPESFLRPYAEALLNSCDPPTSPLFELYYREALTEGNSCVNISGPPGPGCFFVDECSPGVATLTEIGDVLASRATTLFWEVSKFISADAVPEHMWSMNNIANELDD